MKRIYYNMSLSAIICCVSLAFCACASSGAPGWTRNPYSVYDKQTDVAVVGVAGNRQDAEKKAFANLVAYFGQSVKVDEKLIESYKEAERKGITTSFGSTDFDSAIVIAAGMDSLVGAEISDVWDDGKGSVYAVAVLNKAKAIQTYSNLVTTNKEMIDKLVKIPEKNKNTLDGFARYKFASTVADINITYGNLLSQLGAPEFAKGLRNGDDYRLESFNITKLIPVGIVVKNDKSDRIKDTFAKVFSDLGFRSGGNNSRYVLNVKIVTSPVNMPDSPYKWIRIELSANLTDTGYRGTVLLPYSFNSREGHSTQANAENAAYLEAERKIKEEYKDILSNYLSNLLPQK